MTDSYFLKLKRQTETRLWINNPTKAEVRQHGAVSCTTNPTYSANMLRRDREYALGVVDQCVAESACDNEVADLVQQKLAARVIEGFRPAYEASEGRDGFVSIQGNPHEDTSAATIVDEARRYRKLGPNVIAKIPVTEAGLMAAETLLAEDVPVLFTEVFGLPQMICACETYRKVSRESGKQPACFVTHITGIFDQYLKDFVQREGVDIAPDVLAQAGLAVARRQYRRFTTRRCAGTMLGGGARNTEHFTGLIGGNMHITINWSTAEEILTLSPPVENQMDLETPQEVIDELTEKLPDFPRAWQEDGMTRAAFKDFGPVQLFRSMFIEGWDTLLATIRERRSPAATPTVRLPDSG